MSDGHLDNLLVDSIKLVMTRCACKLDKGDEAVEDSDGSERSVAEPEGKEVEPLVADHSSSSSRAGLGRRCCAPPSLDTC